MPQVKLRPEFEILLTMPGIGKILALTIMLEVGDVRRFAKTGNYASCCRCVKSPFWALLILNLPLRRAPLFKFKC